ncbi:hypothetical protein CLU79DRAFT_749789 [Phycomyces nitens]|nr:hypothetical protein CLU79DRAFT_749789 [Phycomyces nitens]
MNSTPLKKRKSEIKEHRKNKRSKTLDPQTKQSIRPRQNDPPNSPQLPLEQNQHADSDINIKQADNGYNVEIPKNKKKKKKKKRAKDRKESEQEDLQNVQEPKPHSHKVDESTPPTTSIQRSTTTKSKADHTSPETSSEKHTSKKHRKSSSRAMATDQHTASLALEPRKKSKKSSKIISKSKNKKNARNDHQDDENDKKSAKGAYYDSASFPEPQSSGQDPIDSVTADNEPFKDNNQHLDNDDIQMSEHDPDDQDPPVKRRTTRKRSIRKCLTRKPRSKKKTMPSFLKYPKTIQEYCTKTLDLEPTSENIANLTHEEIYDFKVGLYENKKNEFFIKARKNPMTMNEIKELKKLNPNLWIPPKSILEQIENTDDFPAIYSAVDVRCKLLPVKRIQPEPQDLEDLEYDQTFVAYRQLFESARFEAESFGVDSSLEGSFIGASFWSKVEKNRFFTAIERCGIKKPNAIHKRVGPTKTIYEVCMYLSVLGEGSKDFPLESGVLEETDMESDTCLPFAHEVSDYWIGVEEREAQRLSRADEWAFLIQDADLQGIDCSTRVNFKKRQLNATDPKAYGVPDISSDEDSDTPDDEYDQCFEELSRQKQRREKKEWNEDLMTFTDGVMPQEYFLDYEKDDLEKAQEMFDVWNMSSMAAHVYLQNPYAQITRGFIVLFYRELVDLLKSTMQMLYTASFNNRKKPTKPRETIVLYDTDSSQDTDVEYNDNAYYVTKEDVKSIMRYQTKKWGSMDQEGDKRYKKVSKKFMRKLPSRLGYDLAYTHTKHVSILRPDGTGTLYRSRTAPKTFEKNDDLVETDTRESQTESSDSSMEEDIYEYSDYEEKSDEGESDYEDQLSKEQELETHMEFYDKLHERTLFKYLG